MNSWLRKGNKQSRVDQSNRSYPKYLGSNRGLLHAWVPFGKVSFVKGTKEVVRPGRPLTRNVQQQQGYWKRLSGDTLNTDTGIEVIPGLPCTSRFSRATHSWGYTKKIKLRSDHYLAAHTWKNSLGRCTTRDGKFNKIKEFLLPTGKTTPGLQKHHLF